MCPFTLKRKKLEPKLHPIHNVTAAVSLTIQIFVFIHGLFYIRDYIDFSSFVLGFNDMFTLLLCRFMSIIIVFESCAKRSQQMKFLKMIEEIDEILVRKLQINIEYGEGRKWNLIHLIFQIFYFALLNFIVFYTQKTVGMAENYEIFWGFISIPIFFGIMRYHQSICFIYLISDRYSAMNEYISTIRLNNQIFLVSKSIFSIRARKMKLEKNFHLNVIAEKLELIQNAYHLLQESYIIVNHLFNWSMILNFLNDFQNALAATYFIIYQLIDGVSGFPVLTGTIWLGLNLYNFLTILTACRSIKIQVNYRSNYRENC